MESSLFLKSLRREGSSFFSEVSKASEGAYLILLSLYVAIYFMLKIAWRESIDHGVDMFRYGILSIVMWGSTVYLFFIIAAWKDLWKKNIPLIIVGAVMLAITGFFSTKMSTNSYGVVFDIFFCLMAFGKDYKKILRCILGVSVLMLIIAAIGVPLAFTLDLEKPDYISTTHSLGINYPNTWGYLVFLALMLLWYLYLRHRPYITFPLFWAICWFMFKYISCNTIAALTAVFPVGALIVDFIEKYADKKNSAPLKNEKKSKTGLLGWIIIVIPFLSFALMYLASINYTWLHAHFYGTRLGNFAMRFVQGGLYFETYGLPLVGNPYRSNQISYVNVNGSFEKVGILDSSFAAYLIMRGLIWMAYTLLWLCIANWKALKKRDYAIPFLGAIILLFAMMERPGLEMWYNFILLYPLAKVVSKPGTEKVFEFCIYDEATSNISTDDTRQVRDDPADGAVGESVEGFIEHSSELPTMVENENDNHISG